MNLPDSFYIALCMTVLLVGAIYWVWTQIQYVQRKVNVLENAMYELKTLCSRPQPPDVHVGAVGSIAASVPSPYPPAPSSVLGEDEDLLHEQLRQEAASPLMMEEPHEEHHDEPILAADDDLPDFVNAEEEHDEKHEDAPVSSSMADYIKMVDEDNQSADALQPGGVGSGIVSVNSTLESMSIKELRRLGQQKGISNANELKKKELVAAIRAIPVGMFDA
jgi:hypothetical protein